MFPHKLTPQEQMTNRQSFFAFSSQTVLILVIACLQFLGALAIAQETQNGVLPTRRTEANPLRVRRVLILHSFGRNFAPFTEVSSTFRTELARQAVAPVEFVEASLESTMFAEDSSETPLVDYLKALFVNRPADLIVAVGAPAMFFLQRQNLFPNLPVLAIAGDKRRVSDLPRANTRVLGISLDLEGIVEHILRILPKTRNI